MITNRRPLYNRRFRFILGFFRCWAMLIKNRSPRFLHHWLNNLKCSMSITVRQPSQSPEKTSLPYGELRTAVSPSADLPSAFLSFLTAPLLSASVCVWIKHQDLVFVLLLLISGTYDLDNPAVASVCFNFMQPFLRIWSPLLQTCRHLSRTRIQKFSCRQVDHLRDLPRPASPQSLPLLHFIFPAR